MINFLPPKEKQILLKEKQFREILILGIITFVFFSFLGVLLFLIKIDLGIKLSLQKEILAQQNKEFEISEIKDLEQEAASFNKILTKLDSFYQDRFYLSDVFEGLSETLSPGMYLTSVSYQSQEKEISLSGFSPTRAILLEFKEALEKKEGFKDVGFPSSNWLDPLDIDFSVTFKIK